VAQLRGPRALHATRQPQRHLRGLHATAARRVLLARAGAGISQQHNSCTPYRLDFSMYQSGIEVALLKPPVKALNPLNRLNAIVV
jgi:hypothetical protein